MRRNGGFSRKHLMHITEFFLLHAFSGCQNSRSIGRWRLPSKELPAHIRTDLVQLIRVPATLHELISGWSPASGSSKEKRCELCSDSYSSPDPGTDLTCRSGTGPSLKPSAAAAPCLGLLLGQLDREQKNIGVSYERTVGDFFPLF